MKQKVNLWNVYFGRFKKKLKKKKKLETQRRLLKKKCHKSGK